MLPYPSNRSQNALLRLDSSLSSQWHREFSIGAKSMVARAVTGSPQWATSAARL